MIFIKKLLFISLIVILSISVYASKETDWIVSKSQSGKYSTIEQASLALLALDKEKGSTIEIIASEEQLKEYITSCTSSNSCNNKDLALATLALKESGDTSQTLQTGANWLINSRTIIAQDIAADDWLIQIISNTAGNCLVNNTEAALSKTISVQQGFTPWTSIKDIITQNTNSLQISCPSLQTSDLTISLIKKQTISGILNYFIKEEVRNNKEVNVQLGIPCWGSTYRSVCDHESTSFVLLSLHSQGKNPDPIWLREQSSLGAFQTAVLYKLTNTASYLSTLESTQSASGYWTTPNIFTTSLVYSIIPKSSPASKKALDWINSQKDAVGCWPKPSNFCTVKDTAAAIYAGVSGNSTAAPPTPPAGNRTELVDCDQLCNDEDGCVCPGNCKLSNTPDGQTCGGEKSGGGGTGPEHCITIENCDGLLDDFGRCLDIEGDSCPDTDSPNAFCNNDGICDSSEDCSCFDCKDKSCPALDGQQGACNYFTEICETTPGAGGGDEPPERGKTTDEGMSTFALVLWIIALLLALVGGSYFAYKKGLIKFKQKPGREPAQSYTPKMKSSPAAYTPRMRSTPAKHPIKNFIDKELDKSIDELEKLLKD